MKVYIVYYEKVCYDNGGHPYIDKQTDSVFDSQRKAIARAEALLDNGCDFADFFVKEVQ